jgi:4-amino-4-deoxy-L-arabinose transferase-like glycosyltransferase
VLLALWLRLQVAQRLTLIEVDGAYWCGLAAALARGDWARGLSSAWPPLYPALVAIALRISEALGGSGPAALEWSARVVSCLAGALLLWPLFEIARRLIPQAATWVLLLAAVHPRLIEYSAAALSESVFMLAIAVAIAAFLRAEAEAEGGSRLGEAGAGAAFGVAFLARPEALPLALAVGLAGLLRSWRGGVPRLRAPFWVALLVVVLPWLLFLHARTGAWTLGEKGTYNFWRAHRVEYARHFPAPRALPARVNRSPELAPPAAPGELHLGEFVRREPALVLGSTLRRLAVLVASSYPVAIGWPVALLALAGLFTARSGPWWPLFAALLATPLLVAPFSSDRRFLVPMVPLVLPLAAAALAELGRRAGALAMRGVGAALLVGLAFYAGGIPARADRAPGERLAGEKLGREWRTIQESWPGAHFREVVMARKPWVAFYSGALIADLPDVPADSILADANRTEVNVLVVDARAARGDRPQIVPWLDPARGPAGWRLRDSLQAGGEPVLLYVPADSSAER